MALVYHLDCGPADVLRLALLHLPPLLPPTEQLLNAGCRRAPGGELIEVRTGRQLHLHHTYFLQIFHDEGNLITQEAKTLLLKINLMLTNHKMPLIVKRPPRDILGLQPSIHTEMVSANVLK